MAVQAIEKLEVRFLPRDFIIEDVRGDEKSLLSLISSVIKAADNGRFISELLESGELFLH